MPRLETEHAAKNIGRSREIVLRVVDASEIVEGFRVRRPQTEGDPELALRQGVLLIEEKREPHELMGVGVPVVRLRDFTFVLSSIVGALSGALYVLTFGIISPEQFGFECAEERLAHRVVIGIAGRAHRRLHACFTAAPSKGNGRVLTALVGM